MKQPCDLLREAGLKITRQREKILEIFLQTDARLTADDLYLKLREQGEELGLSTIYRTLSSLADQQILERTELPGDASQCFSLTHGGHRHQLTCVRCRKTVLLDECPAEEFLEDVGKKQGYQVIGHSFEVFGICPDCQKNAANQTEDHHEPRDL